MADKVGPKGSGRFAVFCGAMFLAAAVAAPFIKRSWLDPGYVMASWFLCVAAILITWGNNRRRTGEESSTIGQDTISLVLALVAGSVALLDLLYSEN